MKIVYERDTSILSLRTTLFFMCRDKNNTNKKLKRFALNEFISACTVQNEVNVKDAGIFFFIIIIQVS
jgi:hypothetical protein